VASDRNNDVDAVFFDFGGVLSSGPFKTFARYEADNGLRDGFIRSLNAANPDDNAWARLERNELGFEEFCDAFEAEARSAGGELDVRSLFAALTLDLRPSMVGAVNRCRSCFKTGLLTNNFVSRFGTVIGDDSGDSAARLADVLSLFDVVVESSVVGLRKPDPAFYLLACRRLEVSPERVVFLDDLGVNLKPARALGMTTIKVEDPETAITALETVLGIGLR
jgi:putative hydrolase of the HAD superfamily